MVLVVVLARERLATARGVEAVAQQARHDRPGVLLVEEDGARLVSSLLESSSRTAQERPVGVQPVDVVEIGAGQPADRVVFAGLRGG